MPNFDEISQSMAEIKLRPVSENGRPLYWNSISGFAIDLCVVIGMLFCICLPNFVVLRRSSAELWHHMHFFNMAADSHIGFSLGDVRQPTKCNSRSQLSPQILSWSGLLFWRYYDFYILSFSLEIAYSRPFLRVLRWGKREFRVFLRKIVENINIFSSHPKNGVDFVEP